MKMIVLYDSECRFCNYSIDFIMNRDPNRYFHFAHLSSDTGKQLINNLKIPSNIDSLILINGNQFYTESTAVLKISKKLNKAWPLFYPLIIVPKYFRDPLYRLIANNRYNLFGKAKSCKIPNSQDRKRFLL